MINKYVDKRVEILDNVQSDVLKLPPFNIIHDNINYMPFPIQHDNIQFLRHLLPLQPYICLEI